MTAVALVGAVIALHGLLIVVAAIVFRRTPPEVAARLARRLVGPTGTRQHLAAVGSVVILLGLAVVAISVFGS